LRNLFILFVSSPQSFYTDYPNLHEERDACLLKHIPLLASLKLFYTFLMDLYNTQTRFMFYYH